LQVRNHHATAAWEPHRNDARATASWRVAVKDARSKLSRLYPA